MDTFRKTRAIVNLDHLIENTKNLRKNFSKDSFYCPMVKANAYGVGAVPVVQALTKAGVDRVGVSLIEEAIELRQAKYSGEIFVYGSLNGGFQELAPNNLTPIISDFSHIEALKSSSRPLSVHLKFDTGMSRLGFTAEDIGKLLQVFLENRNLKLTGILSHLHTGDQVQATIEQVNRFKKIVPHFETLKPMVHLWNSFGINTLNGNPASFPGTEGWGTRPGIGIYGGAGQKTVVSLRSSLVQTHRIPKGQGVSYNHIWKAERETLVGTVTCGYADGYHRRLSNRAQVLVCGERAPVIGTVCMDYFMIDLTDLEKKNPGKDFRREEVTLYGFDQNGRHLDINEVATLAETNSYEILTSISKRVPREYQGGR